MKRVWMSRVAGLALLAIPGAIAAQTWSGLTPAGEPPTARSAHDAVFDTATNQMLIFGGTTPNSDLNDVWSLRLGSSPQWAQVSPSGNAPAGRTGAAVAYDSANSRMIIFGGGLGRSSPCSNDVWVLSNANSLNGTPIWTQLNPTGGPPAPRIFSTAVYDPNSNQMIVYGGNNCFTQGGVFYGDVWTLSNANGLGGTPVWTQLSPTGTVPAARENHTAVYDPASNRMTIFGGNDSLAGGPSVNDVWVLTNANGVSGTPAWSQLTPSGTSPPGRAGSTAVYDPVSNRMMVFGGNNASGYFNDTWVLSNANGLGGTPAWDETASSGTLPPARSEHTAVYDPNANEMIVFGGLGLPGETALNDTWVLSDANGVAGFQVIPGALKQVSVGADGTVWGVNSANEIFMYNAQAQSWTQAPGELVQVAVGSANAVWGINAIGEIYRWNANAGSWDLIPGNLSQIAVGADGDVWGINYASEIYQFSSSSQSWQQIPGSLKQIAVGFDGAVWGVNDSNGVYRFNPGTGLFGEVPGVMTSVAVGADGDVWALNNGNGYHFDRVTQTFDQIPGTLSQISVGTGSNVWGVGGTGQVYEYDAQSRSWIPVGTTLFAQVSAGANGAVWGIDTSNNIYQFTGLTQSSGVLHQIPGTLAQIAVGIDGNAWGLGSSGQIYTFNPLSQTWVNIPGALSQISVGFGGNVWGLNASEQIWRYDSTAQTWDAIAGSLTQIAVGAKGDVWGINSAQQIYRFDAATQGWTSIPGSLRQIAVGADGAVWGINYANDIYKFDALTQTWVQTPGTLMQIAVGSATNVWGINAQGGAYRFESPSQSWLYVPGVFLTQIAVAFDGAVWGIDSANQVWYFNELNQTWSQVPGSLSQIVVGSDGAIWGLDSAGSIYWYR